jgi:hypothetical protein
VVEALPEVDSGEHLLVVAPLEPRVEARRAAVERLATEVAVPPGDGPVVAGATSKSSKLRR